MFHHITNEDLESKIKHFIDNIGTFELEVEQVPRILNPDDDDYEPIDSEFFEHDEEELPLLKNIRKIGEIDDRRALHYHKELSQFLINMGYEKEDVQLIQSTTTGFSHLEAIFELRDAPMPTIEDIQAGDELRKPDSFPITIQNLAIQQWNDILARAGCTIATEDKTYTPQEAILRYYKGSTARISGLFAGSYYSLLEFMQYKLIAIEIEQREKEGKPIDANMAGDSFHKKESEKFLELFKQYIKKMNQEYENIVNHHGSLIAHHKRWMNSHE